MADLGAHLTLTTDDEGGLVVVGEVDAHTAPQLDEAITTALDASVGSVVRVDVAGVDFMDSSGLRVLLAAVGRARKDGGDVALAVPSQPVLRLLDVSGLADHFTFTD